MHFHTTPFFPRNLEFLEITNEETMMYTAIRREKSSAHARTTRLVLKPSIRSSSATFSFLNKWRRTEKYIIKKENLSHFVLKFIEVKAVFTFYPNYHHLANLQHTLHRSQVTDRNTINKETISTDHLRERIIFLCFEEIEGKAKAIHGHALQHVIPHYKRKKSSEFRSKPNILVSSWIIHLL